MKPPGSIPGSSIGDVSRWCIDEDLYAEKDGLQRKFIEENPQEELSKILQADGKTGTVDICPVEVPAAEWRLTKAPAQQQKEVEEQSKMTQALIDGSFDKVCVDSGAGESVCPVTASPSYGTVQTSKTGANYRAAGGQKLTNVGEIRPNFLTMDSWPRWLSRRRRT